MHTHLTGLKTKKQKKYATVFSSASTRNHGYRHIYAISITTVFAAMCGGGPIALSAPNMQYTRPVYLSVTQECINTGFR